jgi:Mrp family chromosome partitioning ATPase
VILVVRAGSSRRRLREALDALEDVDAPLLGVVLNRVGRK